MKTNTVLGCLLTMLWASTRIFAQNADSIVIVKSDRKLMIYKNGQVFKTYQVSLGKSPTGAKTKQGDNRTPEGKYIIDGKNPKSKFHKNLGINYPNVQDKKLGRTGGLIKIHGLRNGMGWLKKIHRIKDWTAGCITVTDDEIDEIYSLVKVKTPISIYP